MEDEKERPEEKKLDWKEEERGEKYGNIGSYKVKKRSCKVKKTPTSQLGVEERGDENAG